MPNFINIANDDASPVLIDAEGVTAVWVNEQNLTAGVTDIKGNCLYLEKDNDWWGVDIKTLAQKIIDAGNPLVSMPRRPADSSEQPWYISPAAVTFITTSQESADGRMGVIVGVKGSVRYENSDATRAEVNALIAAIKQTGKTLLDFDPAEAAARWAQAEKLYVAPAEIVRMNGDGMKTQLNVLFDGCSSLDVNTPYQDMSEIMKQLKSENPGKDFDDLTSLAYIRKDELEASATKALADKLAAANGTLAELEGGRHPIHFNPADVMRAYTQDNAKLLGTSYPAFEAIIEMYPLKGNQYSDYVRTSFNTAAERQTALDKALPSVKKPNPGAKLTPKKN